MLISSVDAADLSVLCDRVLVFREGTVIAELTGDMTQDDIIHATFEPARRSARQAAVEHPAQDPELNAKGVAR